MADIYQTSDYTDWWTKMYGNTVNSGTILSAPVKTFTGSDGKEKTLSDADYRIGQQLYDSYKQGMQYQNDYDTAVNASKTAMENAKIEADVSRQRLEKYLPQQLAMQGLYGTGMSEDAYLRLQNQYQKAVSDANATHNANLNSYKSALDSQKHSLWQQTTDGVNKIVDDEKIEQERIKTELSNNYNTASERLATGIFNNSKEIEDYVNSWKDKVSGEDFVQLQNEAIALIKDYGYGTEGLTNESIKTAVDSSKIRTLTVNEYEGETNEWDLEVKVGDNILKVEPDGETENPEVAKYAAENNIKYGEIFLYNEKPYVYNGSTAYIIKSLGTKEYNAHYNDVMCYLLYGDTTCPNLNKYYDQNWIESLWEDLMRPH